MGAFQFVNGKQMWKHFLFSVVMGVVAALASVILCICVNFVYYLYSHNWWLVFLLAFLGIAELLLYHFWHLPLDLTTHKVVEYMRE
ncbi:MAG: hypothetical protein LUB61_04495, partial [Eggerthellaceae bacterium]|nr:hypothetical protein [Eggerthellaceae bacterium]